MKSVRYFSADIYWLPMEWIDTFETGNLIQMHPSFQIYANRWPNLRLLLQYQHANLPALIDHVVIKIALHEEVMERSPSQLDII